MLYPDRRLYKQAQKRLTMLMQMTIVIINTQTQTGRIRYNVSRQLDLTYYTLYAVTT